MRKNGNYTGRRLLRDFWQEQLAEAQKDAQQDDPVKREITLVSFLSFSRGRGRTKRRRGREVTLVKYGKRAWALTDIPHNGLDKVAQEVLEGYLPPGTDEWKEFLKRVEKLKPK